MLHGELRGGRGNGSCRGLSVERQVRDLSGFLALSLPFPRLTIATGRSQSFAFRSTVPSRKAGESRHSRESDKAAHYTETKTHRRYN